MFGNKSVDEWIEDYEQGHQHPMNRLTHLFGIPMIAASLLLLPLWFLAETPWKHLPPVLFIVGWAFQFIGHAFEGKPPEFFKDWRFLFIGLRWWFKAITGKA